MNAAHTHTHTEGGNAHLGTLLLNFSAIYDVLQQ